LLLTEIVLATRPEHLATVVDVFGGREDEAARAPGPLAVLCELGSAVGVVALEERGGEVGLAPGTRAVADGAATSDVEGALVEDPAPAAA
jgi:hypothetical protein